MVDTDCPRCGVSYDVGSRKCNEPNCDVIVVRTKKTTRAKTDGRFVNPIMARWHTVRARALKKGLDFNLTIEFISELLKQCCAYCGSPERPEVDRKHNDKGYTMDNVLPACRRCNRVKNDDVSYEEMIFIARYLGWRDLQNGNILDDING